MSENLSQAEIEKWQRCIHALHRQHYALAQQMGERIKETEDRHIFLDELEKIPAP